MRIGRLAVQFGMAAFLGNFLCAQDAPRIVMVLGDSLSAGYGLDSAQAYPAILQQKIDEAGFNFRVVNAGVSGDTSAGGLRRIDWVLRDEIDVLILELGANDGLRGIPLESTRENLQGIIDKTLQHSPSAKIIVAGMMVPPNLGPLYSDKFRNLYSELASKNNADLIPFLLEDVAGKSKLNLNDGIHPNPKGHERVAETVWAALEPVLRSIDETTQGL
jgi:acyl-CoA thioesterase-1